MTVAQLNRYFGAAAASSPTVGGAAPTGTPIDYSFDSPGAANWRPEITYEWEIDLGVIPGFTITAANFITDLFPASVFHMSPNKLGKNAVTVGIPDKIEEMAPIPEPSTIVVWSVLGLMFTFGSCRRRRRQA